MSFAWNGGFGCLLRGSVGEYELTGDGRQSLKRNGPNGPLPGPPYRGGLTNLVVSHGAKKDIIEWGRPPSLNIAHRAVGL